MTLEELEKISETEWEQASLNVLISLQKRYNKTACNMLAEGKTIEDIVCESIQDLITGKRKFNSEKNLLENLRLIARSKISWSFSSSDHKKRIYVDPSDEEHEHMMEEGGWLRELPKEIDYDFFLSELINEVADDEELQLVLMAIWDDGETKSSRIAEITDFDIKRVYELRRKLGDKAKKVQRRILSNKISMS